MTKTQAFIGSLAAIAAGITLAIIGGLQHNEAMFAAGLALLSGGAGWFGLQRPADK
jgi:hypothetical protein